MPAENAAPKMQDINWAPNTNSRRKCAPKKHHSAIDKVHNTHKLSCCPCNSCHSCSSLVQNLQEGMHLASLIARNRECSGCARHWTILYLWLPNRVQMSFCGGQTGSSVSIHFSDCILSMAAQSGPSILLSIPYKTKLVLLALVTGSRTPLPATCKQNVIASSRHD
jgi:hypothetical protein